MKKTQAPDTRPAIAFDSATEVRIVMDALRGQRHKVPQTHKESIRKLEDVYSEVLKMFKRN